MKKNAQKLENLYKSSKVDDFFKVLALKKFKMAYFMQSTWKSISFNI